MNGIPWIIITLAVVGALAVAYVILAIRRGVELKGRDYRFFFIIGISYLIVGIGLSFAFPQDVSYFNFFTIMGIILTTMGLANIDKWRKKGTTHGPSP